MGVPISSRFSASRGQTAAIVLGARTTQAVLLQRNGDKFSLLSYTLCETPTYPKEEAQAALTAHLKSVFGSLGALTKEVILVVGMGDVLLRTVELPPVDEAQARQMLKVNGRNYVQQELADYEIDCVLLDMVGEEAPKTASSENPAEFGEEGTTIIKKRSPKRRVLVGAGRKSMVEELLAAASGAELIVSQITFTQTSLANVTCLAVPQDTEKEVVAILDLGFRTSTVSILSGGQLLLTRVVNMGADQISRDLAESMGVSYAAAEGVKTLMPEKVEPKLRMLLASLTPELRGAIDFFEHQETRQVVKAFVVGGSARSNFIFENLHSELGTPCVRLDPTSFLEIALPAGKADGLAKDAPQLAAAIGAAITWSTPGSTRINLLIERQNIAEMHRKDPVRRAAIGAGAIVLVMVVWAGLLLAKISVRVIELRTAQNQLSGLKKMVDQVQKYSQDAGKNERTTLNLKEHWAKRSLWAPTLNALQEVDVEGVELMRLSINQSIIKPKAKPPTPPAESGAKPASGTAPKPPPPKLEPAFERVSIIIGAKNYGSQEAREKFIDKLSKHPYFQAHFREVDPVVLISRLPPQIDPMDPDRVFSVFTLECVFRDQILGYE